MPLKDGNRMEHCMHCGVVVTDKTVEPTQYNLGHVHVPIRDSWGWEQVVIICVKCLDINQPTEDKLRQATSEYFQKSGREEKPVNKNYGFNSLLRVDPAKAEELLKYLTSFGHEVIMDDTTDEESEKLFLQWAREKESEGMIYKPGVGWGPPS